MLSSSVILTRHEYACLPSAPTRGCHSNSCFRLCADPSINAILKTARLPIRAAGKSNTERRFRTFDPTQPNLLRAITARLSTQMENYEAFAATVINPAQGNNNLGAKLSQRRIFSLARARGWGWHQKPQNLFKFELTGSEAQLSLDLKIDSVFWVSNEDIGIVFY